MTPTVRISGGAAPRDHELARRELAAEAAVGARLSKALPEAAHVLQVGGADTQLAHDYLRAHPASRWHVHAEHDLPADTTGQPRFDLIVVDTPLQRLSDPLHLLRRLAELAGPEAVLYAHAANSAKLEMIQRIVEADLSSDEAGPTDVDAPKHYSPASIYKLLMDAGWMPNLLDQQPAAAVNEGVAAAAWAMADALGVPRRTAARTLGMDRLIIDARRTFADALPDTSGAACFSVVVPTTRETQLRLNVEQSPGLREVGAQVVSLRHAHNPAQALEEALPHCDQDWVLLCHQDVYFPAGFGRRLNALLAGIPATERERTLIGFAGVAVNDQADGTAPAGFVIDRLHRVDHAASERVLSIDELAIVVSRGSIHRIDPRIGWHLWATDMCLTAICEHKLFPRIVRLPLFHNSLNDFTLPQAFHESAAYLSAKHASFGPIPTLCGTIDERFLARHKAVSPPAAAKTVAAPVRPRGEGGMCVHLDDVSAEVDTLTQDRRYDDALSRIVAGVHNNYRLETVAHKALYYPDLDRQVGTLAGILEALRPGTEAGVSDSHLIIATELYQIGGHSKIVEDLSRELTSPVVVLTDLFGTCHKDGRQLAWVRERLRPATVVALPQASLWSKCEMLHEIARSLQPRSISYLSHHQDPIPFVATLGRTRARKILFHHGDHNPSLGCTLPGLRHVDLSPAAQKACTHGLDRPVDHLPMHVEDQGVRPVPVFKRRGFSVVTSGHPAKFVRAGEFALQEIVMTALRSITGTFFHIGPLDEAWVGEIRAYLARNAVDASRFVHLGLVPSVWAALKQIDAAFYLGSAPVAGGRASVEAQGCGLPVLFFNGFETGPLVENYSLFADGSLGWSGMDQLGALLQTVGPRHAELSAQARRFYEANFSREKFQQALAEILAA